jgi:valyl-tRNA synthetase
VYLHSIVRDAEGQKMSKSKGTCADPMELTQKYGADAMRFALAIQAAPGTDIFWSDDRILSYRAFANKIWNAARFLFVNLEKFEAAGAKLEDLAAPEGRTAAPYRASGSLALVDRWIFSRVARTAAQMRNALDILRFHEAAHIVYHFFWGEFCDWYIEWVKPQLASADREAATAAWRNLFAVFEAALRLLHPFMPFLTEELWHQLPQRAGAKSIALERFPEPRNEWMDAEAEQHLALLRDIIVAARNIRADLKLDPKRKVAADFSPADGSVRRLLEENLDAVLRLASLSALHVTHGRLAPAGGPIRSAAEFDLRIPYGEAMDIRAEVERLRKQKEKLARDLEAKQNRLADQTFRSRAPEQIVRSLESTLHERQVEYDKLVERLAQLEKSLGERASAS